MPEIPSKQLRDAELVYAHGLIKGQTGLSEIYDYHLSGKNGKRVYEINAKGKLVQSLSITKPLKGTDLHTLPILKLKKVRQSILEIEEVLLLQ